MSPEEVRLRSLYLFLNCSSAVEQFTDRLAATFPAAPLSSRVVLDRALRRELGMLFRYWTTRQIWSRMESREEDAKRLNLTLLRLFTEGFRLPKDGSGLRYAELSTSAEEVRELGQRITDVLGTAYEPLLTDLQATIPPWREAVIKYTREALELPLTEISTAVKVWAERTPPEPIDRPRPL